MPNIKVIDISQHTDAWFQWRSEGVTASEIPIILGLSPYKTPWQLWAEKIGRINSVDISKNPNVQRGVRLEDKARQLAEARYGESLLPICGECVEWNILRASFDGVNAMLEPFEFKAPSDNVWNDIQVKGTQSETYKLYEAQVHAQCVVANSSSGRLIFYKADGQDVDLPVTLTQERRAEIIFAAKAFWNHVVTRTPPALDPLRDWYIPSNGNDRFKWDSYAESWRAQQHRIKVLKDELTVLETEQKVIQKGMTTLMGPFMQADLGGVKVTRFVKKGNVDYVAFINDNYCPSGVTDDELDPYRKTSREESRFSISEDELVNLDPYEVISLVKPSYF
jgi:putative phage-type endonuclease